MQAMWCDVVGDEAAGVAGDDARQTKGAAKSSRMQGSWRMCGTKIALACVTTRAESYLGTIHLQMNPVVGAPTPTVHQSLHAECTKTRRETGDGRGRPSGEINNVRSVTWDLCEPPSIFHSSLLSSFATGRRTGASPFTSSSICNL